MVYFDPSERDERLNLIEGLMRAPSTQLQRPVENQLTEALAWLLDRSPAFARRFACLFMDGDDEAINAVNGSAEVASSTQVPLPNLPGTGTPRPDLTIVGSDRSFQLLVEVKVDAPLHHYELDGELVGQVETYILAWQTTEPSAEAKVRKVGTLSRALDVQHVGQPMRGADVRWAAVAKLLGDLLEGDALPAEVAAVARDYLHVLDQKVLAVGPDVAGLDPFLAWGKKLLYVLRPRLLKRIPASHATGPIISPSDYTGCYLEFNSPTSEQVRLWLYVTAAGGKYSISGAPDALWLAIEPPGPALLSNASPPVFELVRDNAGYPAWRASLPTAEFEVEGNLEAQAGHITERVVALLALAGLIPDASPHRAS